MAAIEEASRRISKATYVPIQVHVADRPEGRAVEKSNFVSMLDLQPDEVRHVRANLGEDVLSDEAWSALESYEAGGRPGAPPSASRFATVDHRALLAFGGAVLDGRRSASAERFERRGESRSRGDDAGSPYEPIEAAQRETLVNAAASAVASFTALVSASPIGMLHLERLEMSPAGITRGELLATIPLAPKESTSVVQREWSVTSQELSTIVTDSLEGFVETGVTEKSELAQSSESQSKRSTQVDLSAAVSGSYGMVTFSTSSKLDIQQASEESAAESRKHSIETTRKASTRSKKEHKVTISTQSVVGRDETTTRTLSNPSDTDPIRIDYFGLIRKWRVRLYRYGLRLTYDVAIPEPGATLRSPYAALANLEAKAAEPFKFELEVDDIVDGTYLQKAADAGAAASPPPAPTMDFDVGGPVGNLGDNSSWRFYQVDFTVPDGYEVEHIVLDAMLGNQAQASRAFILFGTPSPWGQRLNAGETFLFEDVTANYGFKAGARGRQTVTYWFTWIDAASVLFHVHCRRTDESFGQWQLETWSSIRDAVRDAFYSRQQALRAEIDARLADLEGVDSLTLRREENEELMKGILRWLLGPAFEFMPQEVIDVFAKAGDAGHGVNFTGNQLGISGASWLTMFRYQEMVKFIHEAIEWENLLYFPYGYIWDIPLAWEFVRGLRHPDPTRQRFLRSGSARVVLTVRPGFEEAWINFVNNGAFGTELVPNHPYLTIGEEIRAYDHTNYPGIPPANPQDEEKGVEATGAAERGQLIAEWFEYTPTSGVDIAVTSNLATIA